MQKEQLLSILPKNREWFVVPTCPEAETRWGHFLAKKREEGTILHPELVVVNMGETEMCVQTIQKIGVGEETRFVVAPYPGLLIGRGQVMRPLMEQPRGESFAHTYLLKEYVHETLEIPLDSQWYIAGMTRLLQEVVDGGIDAEAFAETLHAFEDIYGLGS